MRWGFFKLRTRTCLGGRHRERLQSRGQPTVFCNEFCLRELLKCLLHAMRHINLLETDFRIVLSHFGRLISAILLNLLRKTQIAVAPSLVKSPQIEITQLGHV